MGTISNRSNGLVENRKLYQLEQKPPSGVFAKICRAEARARCGNSVRRYECVGEEEEWAGRPRGEACMRLTTCVCTHCFFSFYVSLSSFVFRFLPYSSLSIHLSFYLSPFSELFVLIWLCFVIFSSLYCVRCIYHRIYPLCAVFLFCAWLSG